MAVDNVVANPGVGGAVIAADNVTTLNGAGSADVLVQRVKPMYGDDGDARDVSDAHGMPVRLQAGDSAGALIVGTVLAPTITKGTQPAVGFGVQQLKDSGRTIVNAATAIAGVTCANAEAMVALDVSREAAATASVTTIAVTAGKRYRITGIVVGMVSSAAAVISGRVSLRMNPAGAAVVASPILVTVPLSSAPAVAQQGNQMAIMFHEGIEISGTEQVGLSQVFSVATGTMWASILGYEY